MTIIPSTNTKNYTQNHRLGSIDNPSSQSGKTTDKHRKKSIHQPCKKPASRKGYSELSERLFGKVRSTKPLNCKNPDCGSKNLRYTKGKACHAIQAWCKDCGASFPVAKVLAPHIQHLIEPECPEEKIICKHCNQPANIIDEHYYQCWNCAGRIVKLDINSE